MVTKLRSPGQTAISVSIPLDLLNQVDGRAKALGLTRSLYLAQLARKDLADRGDLTLRETPPNSTNLTASEAKVVEIVKSYGKKVPK